MTGLSFSELWDVSQTFRLLFFHNGVLDRRSGGKERAEACWELRYPMIDWGLCSYENCVSFAVCGEMCTVHSKELKKELPKWKWHRGILYRMVTRHDQATDGKSAICPTQYVRNDVHIWQYNNGKMPVGHKVRFIDGNPFNHHVDNLVVLTKVSAAAFDQGVLTIDEALDLDESLPVEIRRRFSGGRKKKKWVYGLAEISRAANITVSRVRQDISRGVFDPGKLDSVVEFCSRRTNGSRIEKNWSGSNG
jgi:hypothetical protein